MRSFSLSHLTDVALRNDLNKAAPGESGATAWLLAHIAEFDLRKLYLAEAFPSTYHYCVGELNLSEDAAYKRIQAARVARRFPVIFELLDDGRLHLSGICLLAPYLIEGNANELLAAAVHKSKAAINQMLKAKFPETESFDLVMKVPAARGAQAAVGEIEATGVAGAGEAAGASEAASAGAAACEGAGTGASVGAGATAQHDGHGHVGGPGSTAPHVDTPATRTKILPIAADRFTIQVTVSQSTHDKLRHAQALLSHQMAGGELAQVLDLALDALISKLEQRKVAATARPHRKRRPSKAARTIPAQVRREVWERDGGQCTFVSESGRRCCARTQLEYDHIDEVARGGEATTDRMRLRCRAHNQYTAEQTFGAEFMARKRAEAREARTRAEAREARMRAAAREARTRAAEAAEASEAAELREAGKSVREFAAVRTREPADVQTRTAAESRARAAAESRAAAASEAAELREAG